MLVWVLVVVTFWLAGRHRCTNWAVVFLGIIPLLVTGAPVVAIGLFGTQPLLPALDAPAPPRALLQEFAWTQRGKAVKLAARNAHLHALAMPAFVSEPLFCVETAIKTFFWATVMYDYAEADGHTFQKLPEAVAALVAQIDDAMALFDLQERQLFHDAGSETLAVVASRPGLILVCVRGTAAAANFLSDVKVRSRPKLLSSMSRVCVCG